MTESTSTDFRARPSREKRPVSTSKTRRAEAAMKTSEASSARPTSMPVYFFRIIAIMSVPPVEAPMLKRMAAPRAGRRTAKKSSSIFSPVKGRERGKNRSKSWMTAE
jgi:hypothetical protein